MRRSSRRAGGRGRPPLLVIPRNDVAQNPRAEAGESFRFVAAVRNRGGDSIRESRERERLQHDVTGSGERRVKKPFTAESRVAESADELPAVIVRASNRLHASGADAHPFACPKIALDDDGAGTEKDQSRSAP